MPAFSVNRCRGATANLRDPRVNGASTLGRYIQLAIIFERRTVTFLVAAASMAARGVSACELGPHRTAGGLRLAQLSAGAVLERGRGARTAAEHGCAHRVAIKGDGDEADACVDA